MSPHAETALLKAVVDEWQALPTSFRPWGVWIRKCPEMMPGDDRINTLLMPDLVWFLDNRGIHSRNIWTWRRFYTVHFTQPWCSKFFSMEPVPVFGQGQIGMAAFAPMGGKQSWYLETQWDGRYGHGWAVYVSRDNQLSVRTELWIS